MRNQILCGDALTTLKTLPDECVQTIVTSPPYYNLRSYLPEGHPDKHLEIGLEKTPAAYIANLVEVFREAQRVLRPDGTLWLNIGDTYAGGSRGRDDSGDNGKFAGPRIERKDNSIPAGFKPKDLMMIPARLAIALQDDGWYLRSEIIWHKPSAMPESVQDRPTRAHEQIYLLAKSEHYFYDAEAIKEPGKEWAGSAGTCERTAGKNILLSLPGQGHASHRSDRSDRVSAGANKRDVWTVASAGYTEAHFATFPPKLIEPCILAGTSPQACEICGSPWKRRTEREFVPQQDVRDTAKLAKASNKGMDDFNGWGATPRGTVNVTTAGWQPTCTCPNHGLAHCIVLDPFMGSGTTALVALKHNRDFCGIELNPEYVKLAQKRISLGPLWEEVEAVS